MMQLDSVVICATTDGALKRLLQHGGAICKQVGKREHGKLRMQLSLVRLPFHTAVELGLILAGPELNAFPAKDQTA